MVIRQNQLATFSELFRRDFVRRGIEHLQSHFPEFYYLGDAATIPAFIEETIDRASICGISEEPAVMRFLDYRVLFGPNFDNATEYAWMARILQSRTRTGLQKIADIDRLQFGYKFEES